MLGFYYRVSTQGQVKNDTMEIQISKAKEWREKNGIKEGEYLEYADKGISGRLGVEHRKGLSNLLRDIQNGTITKIWLFESSRFSRADEDINIKLQKDIKRFSIPIFFYDMGREIDLNNSNDAFVVDINNAVNKFELAKIRMRTKAGREIAQDEGRLAFSAIYGYERDGRDENGNWKWKAIPEKLEIVRKMYKEILNGKSVRQAYKIVAPEIILDCGKNDLSYWYNRLRRPEYAGYSFKADKSSLVKSQIYTEPVATLEEYMGLQNKLTLNKANHINYFEKANYTSTGIVKCYYCNVPYYNNSSKVKGNIYKYYVHYDNKIKNKCNNTRTIKKNELDLLLTYTYLKEYIDRMLNRSLDLNRYHHLMANLLIKDTSQEKLEERLHKLLENNRIIANNLGEDAKNKILWEVFQKNQDEIEAIQRKIRDIKLDEENRENEFEEFKKVRSLDKLKLFFLGKEENKNKELRMFIRTAYIKDEDLFILTKLYDTYKIYVKSIRNNDFLSIENLIDLIKKTLQDKKTDTNAFLKQIEAPYTALSKQLHFDMDLETAEEIFPTHIDTIREAEHLKAIALRHLKEEDN